MAKTSQQLIDEAIKELEAAKSTPFVSPAIQAMENAKALIGRAIQAEYGDGVERARRRKR